MSDAPHVVPGKPPVSAGGRTARHVFLIGFMGSGKSTVGRCVADGLHRPFIDMDALIEQRAGRRVADVFAEDGEARFRELEHATLASLGESTPSVIACGGGVVLSPENRRLLKALGCVVYMVVTAGEALARIGEDGGRPLLASGDPEAAAALLSAREGLYRAAADATVDTDGKAAPEVASETIEALRLAGCVS